MRIEERLFKDLNGTEGHEDLWMVTVTSKFMDTGEEHLDVYVWKHGVKIIASSTCDHTNVKGWGYKARLKLIKKFLKEDYEASKSAA